MKETSNIWLNGQLIPSYDATIPITSHGFSRASAIFEILGTHIGPKGIMAFRLDEHMKRFLKSAELLGMKIPYSSVELISGVAAAVEANKVGRGLVKMMAYWGAAGSVSLLPDSQVDVAIIAMPEAPGLGLDASAPISACLSKWRKLHPQTVPIEAKACANYLNGYLARKDAADRGYDLGILLGTDGFLAEGAVESVFIVKDRVLKTPPTGRVLASITRKSILQAAPIFGISVSETRIPVSDLNEADEMFTANTITKVLPIKKFESRELEAPGPVSQKIKQMMTDILTFKNEQFSEWFQPLGFQCQKA